MLKSHNFLTLMADQAACTMPVRSQRLPCPMVPEKRLPALSLLPGASLAQLTKWAAVGKRLMSAPISASNISAVRRLTPGMVSSSEIASVHVRGAGAESCGVGSTGMSVG